MNWPWQPIHPGEVLFEEFLIPKGMNQNQLALAIGVPAQSVHEIVQGKRSISPSIAAQLAEEFGTSAQYWMNLQIRYDAFLGE